MKVFLSSLISGFEDYRAAARDAVLTLRHEPVMAEEFDAQPNSPQVACLTGLRNSDLVVLILGEKYGAIQPRSGLSATHEEYREAQGKKPIIAFVQTRTTPESAQANFIEEVQNWEGGWFRGAFRTPTDLQTNVVRALHDYDMANAVGALDVEALIQKATALLVPFDRADSYGGPMLNFSLAGGPLQRILRPVELESETLSDALHKAALFGETRVFDPAKGTKIAMEQAACVLQQEQGARVQLDEQGSMLLRLPVSRSAERRSLPVLLEETVQHQLIGAITYAGWVLEHIDSTQKLTHVAVGAKIGGGDMLAWRSQREHDASPDSVSMGAGYGQQRSAVHTSEPRAALRLNPARIAEDLLIPLRRQWKPR